MIGSSVSNLKPCFQIEASQSSNSAVNGKSKKRPSPLSVRLSPEQRVQLERDAADMSLNAYVLSRLFDGGSIKRHKTPTKRDKALARTLRQLGNSGIAMYLTSRLVAHEEGRLELSEKEAGHQKGKGQRQVHCF